MNSEDEAWLGWIETQKSAAKIWIEVGRPTEAIAIVQAFLDKRTSSADLEREALAFRAALFEDLGDTSKAEEDFLSAHQIAHLHGLEKYSIEISLAALFKRNGAAYKAEEWYLKALETASADRGVSGAGALYQLVKLRNNPSFEGREKLLAETVIKQAWNLLELQGEPDLNQLGTSILRLLEAEQGNG